jgi:hypothetical protein
MRYGKNPVGTVRMSRTSTFYTPYIWIEHSSMFATCLVITEKSFVVPVRARRRKFENHLMKALREDWGVLAQTLRLKYSTGKVEVIFEDKDEFIMAKMANGELNSQL